MKKILIILLGFFTALNDLFAPVFKKQQINVFYQPLLKPFKVTQKYGEFHNGTDLISFNKDKKVRNMQTCIIKGIYETVNHTPLVNCKNEYYDFYYLHISLDPYLKENMEIKMGEILGNYNNKGLSHGDHIHIIIIRNSDKTVLNPEKIIKL